MSNLKCIIIIGMLLGANTMHSVASPVLPYSAKQNSMFKTSELCIAEENKTCGQIISKKVKQITYQVPLNKSRLVRFKKAISKMSQSNKRIADFKLFPYHEVLLQGKSLGSTNIYVWDRNNRIMQIMNVEVTHDLETLKYKLDQLLPNEPIEVRSAKNNIIISGQVSGLDKMQAALDIARSFLPSSKEVDAQASANNGVGKGSTTINVNNDKSKEKNKGPTLINMLSVSGAHQVMLEVKVAEIDRRIAKGLKIQFNALRPSSEFSFGALNGGGNFNHIVTDADAFSTGYEVLSNVGGLAGPIRSLFQQNQHSIDAAGIFLSALSGDFIFNLTVDAAKDQDLAKILAEPTLTTMSGQEARFISGGEFPIPVPQASGIGASTIAIVFKEFGVSLRFLPVVLDSGRINLNMNVLVSELSRDAAIATDIGNNDIAFTIPSLTKREASSTLELADGQTMSIAGLISDRVRENVNKFPGLGDIPVLGALFRSESFLKEQTELVIFVTPKLAKPVLAKNIVLPTDSFVEPDDMDFYIFGRLEARNANMKAKIKSIISPDNESLNGGLDGQFGHELIGE